MQPQRIPEWWMAAVVPWWELSPQTSLEMWHGTHHGYGLDLAAEPCRPLHRCIGAPYKARNTWGPTLMGGCHGQRQPRLDSNTAIPSRRRWSQAACGARRAHSSSSFEPTATYLWSHFERWHGPSIGAPPLQPGRLPARIGSVAGARGRRRPGMG
jgi:hypothetical protein